MKEIELAYAELDYIGRNYVPNYFFCSINYNGFGIYYAHIYALGCIQFVGQGGTSYEAILNCVFEAEKAILMSPNCSKYLEYKISRSYQNDLTESLVKLNRFIWGEITNITDKYFYTIYDQQEYLHDRLNYLSGFGAGIY